MNIGKQSGNSNKFAILPMWVIDRIKEEMRLGPAAWQAITDAVEQAEVPQALPCEVKLPPGTVLGQGSPLTTLLMAIAQRASQPAHAQVFGSEQEVQQPHPEPIAWMVGTAFWWTKEEAERDAAATWLPIVGLGPMTGAAPDDQRQSKPVAWRGINELGEVVTDWIDGVPPSAMVDLGGNPASFASIEQAYTHADPGEFERLVAANNKYARQHLEQVGDFERLRAELVESDHAFVRASTKAEQLSAKLAERDALLQRMKTLFRTDDPFDLYDAVCNALAGKS